MRKRFSSGFTIVEIATVIFIIAILATVTLVTYNIVQQQARDTKRQNDITMLANALELYYQNHGEYPTGCSEYTTAHGSYCQANTNTVTSNPDAFYSDTTLDTLRSVLPSLSSDFGDPLEPKNYPFGQNNYGFSIHYVYIGQYDATVTGGAGGGVMGPSASDEIDCDGSTWIYLSTPSGALPKSTTFVLAYWSEADGKWYITQGKYGSHLTNGASGPDVRGTTIGKCVFLK